MTNRDKVTELLKNYPFYKFAIRNFETTGWVAISGTGYSERIQTSGYGPRAPVKFSCDSVQDVMDYNEYKNAVDMVDRAMEELTEEEQYVIKLKWMQDMTLEQIARRRFCHKDTIKRIHRRAIGKLAICFRFVDVPEIEKLPVA